MSGSITTSSGSVVSTVTVTATPPSAGSSSGDVIPYILHLPTKRQSRKRVEWTDDVVDNEQLNKKKSKKCCIFHKQRRFDESSSDDSSDESGDDSDTAAGDEKHNGQVVLIRSVRVTRSSDPDYYGFPPHTYDLKYPAAGDERLSRRVESLLTGTGISAQLDSDRLFDHGVFIPLMLAFPAADIPVVQVSLLSSLDASAHLAIGRALSPLRDEGVLIVGSGFITHNFSPQQSPKPFMNQMTHILTEAQPADRQRALQHWQRIDGATDAHKRADHFMPLFVAVGAAGDDKGTELTKIFVMNDMWCFAHYVFEH